MVSEHKQDPGNIILKISPYSSRNMKYRHMISIEMCSFTTSKAVRIRGELCQMELSIKVMLRILLKRFKLMILLTLIAAGAFFAVTRYVLPPVYTASVQLYVSTGEAASPADLNELTYAQKVVNTYISFLRTKVFYTRVLENTGLDFSQKQLKKMTVIKAVNNTEIFEITVSSYSARTSYQLADAMQRTAPELIREIKASAEISVVDPVVLPQEPSGPNVLINTAAGGMFGFLIAVPASFLWEVIDVKVKDEEDLVGKYQIPIIGSIPSFDHHKRNRRLLTVKKLFQSKRKGKKRIDRILNKDTDFVILEAYKALRTNLRYILRQESCRKLLINSPTPEDGKSTTCTNIGITIAQTGARVLLMDCDLRKGRLHKLFRLKGSPGISDVLSGIVTERDAVQSTSYPNLKVISMGTVPPNPTELLASSQMEELMKNLEKSYDYILIDSPPVNVVSDALSIGKLTDGILLVVKENRTTHPNVEDAIAKYKLIGANILGFVLNEISLEQGSKSKFKYYYYEKKKND